MGLADALQLNQQREQEKDVAKAVAFANSTCHADRAARSHWHARGTINEGAQGGPRSAYLASSKRVAQKSSELRLVVVCRPRA